MNRKTLENRLRRIAGRLDVTLSKSRQTGLWTITGTLKPHRDISTEEVLDVFETMLKEAEDERLQREEDEARSMADQWAEDFPRVFA